jgi:1,2-diacylglycerol 3-alpha-glucosyltransferase
MRIGILADLYLPHISGITVFVSMYQQTLEAFGHEAHIFTFGPAASAEEETRRVHRTPGIRIGKTGFYFSPRHSIRNQALIREMDLLHTTHPFVSGTLAFRYRRNPSTPVVFTSQTRYDLYLRHYLPALAGPPARGLLRAYMPAFCRRCALVIAPSASGIAMLRGLGVEAKIEIIPNAVDLAEFRPAEKFQSGRIRAVYTGRLAAEKNVPFLLRAFALAAEECPGLDLTIIGDGPQRVELENLARRLHLPPRVTFLGERPHRELPALLSDFDLFLTASATEVHPLSLIEAMAAGLAVAAVGGEGISETIRDGESGLLSAPDPADLARKIRRIALDPELGRKLAAGAVRAVQDYDIRRVTRRHLEKFAALLPGERTAHGIGQ